jgi:hypothetical protein
MDPARLGLIRQLASHQDGREYDGRDLKRE